MKITNQHNLSLSENMLKFLETGYVHIDLISMEMNWCPITYQIFG